MGTAQQLISDDFCHRQAHNLLRRDLPSLSPKDILNRAIEHGLTSDADDPGAAAGDFAMELCTQNSIDTPETDLLGLGTHISGLADFLVWLVRARNPPWERPPAKDGWHPASYLSKSERSLRAVLCVARLDGLTEMEMRTSWATQGECAVYGVPMDVLVPVLGSMRAGRWSNPFTVAWRHPVAKALRFRRRDGETFGANWDRIARESDHASREEWLDAMTDDGVLPEALRVLRVEAPEQSAESVTLASTKLARIHAEKEAPEPQPSRCYDRMRPCPFRGDCF